MTNFKLVIEYDGTAYHGWQKQAEDRTVQGEIDKALTVMTREKITLSGSGRTDAGVHALGQVANFHCDTQLTPDNFQQGLNSLLDDDIVIKECQIVSDDFHARFSAVAKTYHYHILNRQLPTAIGRQYTWHIRHPLDFAAMNDALTHIIGEHDFASFEGTGSPRSTTVREVTNAEITTQPDDHLLFQITANGFLRYMVRNIVGTLADIGAGKLSPDDMKTILAAKDRSAASPTAPPQGLFLMKVNY